MSNVFQAIHQTSGSLVALKVLPRKLAQNPILLQRFLKEAKSAEALDHPNIVAIYDRGNDEGRHYLVLEFVDGRDLFEHVRSQGPLNTEAAVRLSLEIALGLRYAAERGMIHRDIKPANLLLTVQGQAKIIDLGLALQTIDEDERVTRQGTTVGTVDYMSPEQARDSRKINESSDIYSFGCTLFFLVTGTPPFAGGTLADKLARHHSAAVPDARDRNPAVSEELAGLISQMMAKLPAGRPAGYDDLIAQLERIRSGLTRFPAAVPLDVIIDDDDSDDAIELTLAHPKPILILPRTDTPQTSVDRLPTTFSLAELAAIDAQDQPTGRTPRRKSKLEPISSIPTNKADSVEEVLISSPIRRTTPDLPLRTWIMAGVVAGLAIALLSFGIRFLTGSFQAEVPLSPSEQTRSEDLPEPQSKLPEPNRLPDRGVAATDRSEGRGGIQSPSKIQPAISIRKPQPRSRLISPLEVGEKDTELLGFPPELQPVEATEDAAIIVRRLDEPGDQVTDSLANALGRLSPMIEIADAGPVREDHFEITGRSKTIRGRGGYQPILRIDTDFQYAARSESAKFRLGGSGVERLTLQDLDLIVDIRDLPTNQTTLFQCQGVELNLIHCTVTLHNAGDRGDFSLIRTLNGPRPNRIYLDRCLIRGPIRRLIDVQSDQCSLDFRRSVVVGGDAPLFRFAPTTRADRSIWTLGCVIFTAGTLLDVAEPAEVISWRSLGSVMVHGSSGLPADWRTTRESRTHRENEGVEFAGWANQWIGWHNYPPSRLVRPQEGQPESQSESRAGSINAQDAFTEQPWPLTFLGEQVTAVDFQQKLTNQITDFSKIAFPSPVLYQETVDRFPRKLDADESVDRLRRDGSDTLPITSLPFDLRSNVEDLGLFLTRNIIDSSRRYEVRIEGSGVHMMTPVRIPDGIKLRILAPPGSAGGSLPVQLTPRRSGQALLEIGRSELLLENLGFSGQEQKDSGALLVSEGGVISARSCTFRSRGDESSTISPALIQVRHSSPSVERPTLMLENCWFWTSRSGITIDSRSESAQLKNCLMLTGYSGIQIQGGNQTKEPLTRLGELCLDNCTVLAERCAIEATDVGSPDIQPTRPFLISSRSCVFPRSWRDQGALIAIERERFARGNLFWDSANDVYDVTRFLVDPADEKGPSGLPDIRRHWVEVWGGNHARADRGPDPRRTERILTFRDAQRGRQTKPTLSQLELDSTSHVRQGVNFANLPGIPRS